MEQTTSNDPSNTPPPPKRSKAQQEEKSPITDATSNHAPPSAANLNPANVEQNQLPSNIVNGENQDQSNKGIFNFIPPSEEDSARAPEENPDPNSPAWRIRELEELGTGPVRKPTLLMFRRDHCLVI